MSETRRTRIGGEYEILDVLGQGGMGEVLKARHKRLDRLVALKVLPPHLLADDEARIRFEREARAGAKLEHDHIVTTYDFGIHDGRPYLAVAFIEGETLAERIRKKGRLSPEETVKLIAPIAEALAYAHRKEIIHRDIKSSNLMIRAEDERPILIDFGIAQASFTRKLTRRGEALGTPEYMSPEQATAQEIDHRSDLYSLGVVLYECLTGTVPFQSTHIEVLLHNIEKKPHRPVRARMPEAPLWLSDVVDRCLAKKPEDRFPDGKALAEALRVGLASKSDEATMEAEMTIAEAETTVPKADTTVRGVEMAVAEVAAVPRAIPLIKDKRFVVALMVLLLLAAVGYSAVDGWFKAPDLPQALRDALRNPTAVDTLYLSFDQLTTVPESITQLTNLTRLRLSFNQLTTVPESITQLTNLKELVLSSNQLKTVPEPITRLTNLKELVLSSNQLKTVPESITQLTNLTRLRLSSNPIPQTEREKIRRLLPNTSISF